MQTVNIHEAKTHLSRLDVTRLYSMDFRHPFGNSIQVITVAL